jgi:hypothetical protein
MSPFITFRDKDKNGELQYYVLQREHPHYVGCISSHPVAGAIAQSPVSGYYLWVVIQSTLRGNFIPAYNNVDKDMAVIADNMAAWFWAERIVSDKKKYKKFKIESNVSKPPEPSNSKD